MAKPWNAGRKVGASCAEAEDLRALLELLPGTSPRRLRDRAMVLLMATSGLRVAELCDLRPEDMEPERGCLVVRSGKGGKRRRAPFAAVAQQTVAEWAQVRDAYAPGPDAPLFCTARGGRVDPSHVRRRLRTLADKAGLGRLHPHALRHGFAVGALRAGAQLNVLQAALGHSNLATTGQYLNHVRPADLAEAGDLVAEALFGEPRS